MLKSADFSSYFRLTLSKIAIAKKVKLSQHALTKERCVILLKRDWVVVGGCVRGADHIRKNMPCQDALHIENRQGFHIISLSDGHGSTRCPYSDEGAKVAVKTVYTIFSHIFKGECDPFHTISANKDIWIPKQIEQHWKSAVHDLHKSKEREQRYPQDLYELYGATLLALVIADDFVFALQLGDGDMLSIKAAIKDNPQVGWVIPPDGRIGQETNSLCQNNCWQHIRTRIIPLSTEKTAPMFLMSTDGYANSFCNEDGFKQAGIDFYELWQNKGVVHIEKNLEGWLAESSTQGSGDDITMALAVSEIKCQKPASIR